MLLHQRDKLCFSQIVWGTGLTLDQFHLHSDTLCVKELGTQWQLIS
jgi:hypothetical protein